MRVEVQGRVSAGFEPVRQAFADNFLLRNELLIRLHSNVFNEQMVFLWGIISISANVDGRYREGEVASAPRC